MRVFIAFISVILSAVLAIAMPAAAQDTSEDRTILILDGSGSMWGQIEGEAKITIAKSVLAELLAELPEERQLGLMAYGHRREGDCTDIEQLAEIGSAHEAIAAQVQKLSPKGKTPMAESIRQAADILEYQERKATVILVSDGIETCDPDPCGAAAELEQNGYDFTVNVIGFDVTEENDQAQLKCLAENTGGTFYSAADAGELGEALEEAVVTEPEVVTVTKVRLRATELEGGLVIEEGLNWSVTDADGNEVYSSEGEGVVDIEIDPGTYDVVVERPSDGLKGEQNGVKIAQNTGKTVTIALNFEVTASVRAEPEGEGMAGTNVLVHWTGPDRRGDYINISQKGADNGRYLSYRYASQGNPSELRLPVEPGDYEIRYTLGRPIRTLASIDYKVLPAEATIEAVSEAIAGEDVSVAFTGPEAGSGDWITIAKPDAPAGKYLGYAYVSKGSPVLLRMPLEAGEYELRYIQGGKKVLARQPITVVVAEATIEAVSEAIAGEDVSVAFTGPEAGSGDYITVAEPDAPAGKYLGYAYVSKGSPVLLRMPLEAGEYELRYIQGGKKVLARQPITVGLADATLVAASEAISGEDVSVTFTGPEAGSGDYITVAEPGSPAGKYLGYAYVSKGSPVLLRMPLDAGEYELRYVQGGKKVIASQPITVVAATATLTAVEEAIAGENVSITFTGPKAGSGDYITIAEPGSPARDYVGYAYVSKGSPLLLRMPFEEGDYELRYLQGNKKVLTSQPMKVLAASATVTPPERAVAGEVSSVVFTGPQPSPGSYVVVAEPGSPVKKYVAYGNITSGSPTNIRMPKDPGEYELRYLHGGVKILASAPMTVYPKE
ncbi:VWA domain-containing protein [Parvularcula marina]|uniref:vWA domain-containing protein n=1 Tax=Parvularcula marina TaxID=2292771 RepID=UPI00351788F3